MPNESSIAAHPDLAELRDRYERVAETPTGQAAEGVIVLGGLYVALSSWLVGFTGPLAMNNLIVGLALAVLGVGFARDYASTHRLAWVIPVLGVWTVIAPFVIVRADPTMSAILGNVIVGAIILLCGLAMLGMGTTRTGMMARRFGR